MGVIGAPVYAGGAIRRIYKYLLNLVSHLSIEKIVVLSVPNLLIMKSLHTKPPPYDFLNLYGACLAAGTEDPKMK